MKKIEGSIFLSVIHTKFVEVSTFSRKVCPSKNQTPKRHHYEL